MNTDEALVSKWLVGQWLLDGKLYGNSRNSGNSDFDEGKKGMEDS